jgi:signal transduction histidine kinase
MNADTIIQAESPLCMPLSFSECLTTPGNGLRSRSRLVEMVVGSQSLPPRRNRVLGTLLQATVPHTYKGTGVLQPIWAAEAMERAYTTLHLMGLLDAAQRRPAGDRCERALATRLAQALQSLTYGDAGLPVAAEHAAMTVAEAAIDLFGPAAGAVQVEIAADPITLPAFQSRALVLLTNDLVVNALRHGLCATQGGRICVTLSRPSATVGRLLVTDTGCGFVHLYPNPYSVAHDLSSLLETEPVFTARAGGGVHASVAFPIRY